MAQKISPDQIKNISSTLLSEGRQYERWQIDSVNIDDEALYADVSMTSTYVSPTDGNGFHLSIFTTLEFLSQLKVIYSHCATGLERKTQEAWMVESHVRCKKSIRNDKRIRVTMKVVKSRKVKGKLYWITESVVTDDSGGCFEVTLKSFLS